MKGLFIRRYSGLALCAAALGYCQAACALSLLQAYEAALKNDPSYRSAVSEKEAGQQYKVLGRSHLLPNVSANYSTSKNRADINNSSRAGDSNEHRAYTSLAATIQLRQPLFHPEGEARYRQGVAQTQVSEAQFLVRSQELIVRLVGLYAPAKYAEDQLSAAIAQSDAYAEQRKANERLLQLGEGTKTEVLEAQAKYDLAQAQIVEARDNLMNARNALAAVVGREITALDALAEDFQVKPMEPASFEAWRDIALANNPEIAAQRLAVTVAVEEVRKNYAGHAPRLDLIANLNRNRSETTNTLNQNSNGYSMGLQLNVPIYSGGSVNAATSQALSNHDKALADLDVKTSQVLVELRKQFSLAQSGVHRISAAEKSLSSARLLVDATQKSVKGGIRTNLDVLNAQHQVFEAKRELSLMRYNYLLSYLRLRYSAGTLGPADLGQIAAFFVAQ